jgi:hypothetical protein
MFPKGKKEGTAQYWRGNKSEIYDRLINFIGNNPDITNEQIITATTKYVHSFGDNINLMRTLKYFIYKNINNNTEKVSDLLSYIENEDENEINMILETTKII